jgi:hypothetical protein
MLASVIAPEVESVMTRLKHSRADRFTMRGALVVIPSGVRHS